MINQNKRSNLSLCGNGAQKCTKQTTMNPLKNAGNSGQRGQNTQRPLINSKHYPEKFKLKQSG